MAREVDTMSPRGEGADDEDEEDVAKPPP